MQQGLLHCTETMAFSNNQIKEVFGNKITDDELKRLGYKRIKDSCYAHGSTQYYYVTNKFYLTERVADVFGAETRVIYDDYSLLPLQTILKTKNNSNLITRIKRSFRIVMLIINLTMITI